MIYSLRVSEINDVATVNNATRLRVLAMPIVPPIGPGSDGHCGIEGCDKSADQTAPKHKDLLQQLAEKAVKVEE